MSKNSPKVAGYYNNAPDGSMDLSTSAWTKIVAPVLMEALKEKIKGGTKALDVGCGNGCVMGFLKDLGVREEHLMGVELTKTSELSLPAKPVDIAVSTMEVQSLDAEDFSRFLEQMHHALVQHGTLCIISPHDERTEGFAQHFDPAQWAVKVHELRVPLTLREDPRYGAIDYPLRLLAVARKREPVDKFFTELIATSRRKLAKEPLHAIYKEARNSAQALQNKGLVKPQVNYRFGPQIRLELAEAEFREAYALALRVNGGQQYYALQLVAEAIQEYLTPATLIRLGIEPYTPPTPSP